MRLDEIEQNSIPPLKVKIDNPAAGGGEGGEKWLQDEREYALEFGFTPFDTMKFLGKPTARFNREAFIPVSVLKDIRGQQGEQEKVRDEDLSWLINYMDKHGKLPPSKAHSHGENPPFIIVDQRGVPAVQEGNHRIMAADKLNWDVLPVGIKYFNGGEMEDGPLTPEKVEQYDQQSLSQGYGFGDYTK